MCDFAPPTSVLPVHGRKYDRETKTFLHPVTKKKKNFHSFVVTDFSKSLNCHRPRRIDCFFCCIVGTAFDKYNNPQNTTTKSGEEQKKYQ